MRYYAQMPGEARSSSARHLTTAVRGLAEETPGWRLRQGDIDARPLATPEEIIVQYLQDNDQITNRISRDLCFIGSENKMKGILQRLVKKGLIELVPGTTRYSAAYRLKKQ